MIFAMYHNLPKSGKLIFPVLRQSILDSGNEVIDIYDKIKVKCDVLVVWSMLGRDAIYDLYHDVPKLIIEVGALKRNVLWRLGWNSISGTGIFANKNSDNARVKLLGLELQNQKQGKNIVICSQNDRSKMWTGGSQVAWILNKISEIQKIYDYPIIIRQHPRSPLSIPGWEIQRPEFVGGYDDFDFPKILEDAFAIINYNSNPAIEAIINGIPIHTDSSSLAFPVSSPLHNLCVPDRDQWICDLSYIEWSVDEIEDGIPLKRLLTCIPE